MAENRPTRRPEPADADASRPAGRSARAVAVFLLLTVVTAAADLWTKHAVFSALLARPDIRRRVDALRDAYGEGLSPSAVLRTLRLRHELPAGVRLTLSTNPGVVFGLPMPPWMVAIATLATIAFVGWFFAVSDRHAAWLHVALAMILGGAVGNFYDRMIAAVDIPGVAAPITGQVRDFLDFSQVKVFGVGYPYIFNVADVWLVVGVAMLMIHWWRAAGAERRAAAAEKSGA